MGKKTGKYSMAGQAPRKSHAGVMVTLMLAFLLIAAISVALWLGKMPQPGSEAPQAADPAAQASSEPITVPAGTPVVTPTNDKTAVTCKASYTVAPGSGDAEKIAATAGDEKLTNGMLQILYLSQVNSYRAAGPKIAPDFSLPLDCQPCPLEEGLSWQHYFLKKAILSWQAQQAALAQAAGPQIITEQAFCPNETDDLHGKNIAPDLPVNNFLYQDLPCYTPNKLHQAYLDSMAQTMDTLAAGAGFADLEAMARQLGVSAGDFLQAALDYNTAYMFFTEKSYGLEPTDEAVSDYLQEQGTQLSGSDGSWEAVDIRHILLIPQGAETAADGTVTATQAQWEQAEQEAQEILTAWRSVPQFREPEGEFARLASIHSEDDASRLDGGYYENLRPGQLVEPLNEWCFSDERQPGDTAIMRSDYGCHIVYLAACRESSRTDARNALVLRLEQEQWTQWLEALPLTPDYSAAELWADTTAAAVTLEDTLYPDIAHERYPEAIVFLQQDYNYIPFGGGYIGSNGCGITTFSMLATYMTDSLQTPAMMSAQFGQRYYDSETHSTNGDIFRFAPAELGFYVDKVSTDINEVVSALENGQVAISLQRPGHFTSKGHYLLLMHYYPEDDTIQVRDSNIFNYGSLKGHQVDRFSRALVADAGSLYYIMQPKITSIPACSRCGSAGSHLLTQDYLCEKCTAALCRRNNFLSILEKYASI